MTPARFLHVARIWRQLLVQYCAVAMAYRVQSIIWMIGGLMPVATMLIWVELAGSGSIGGNGTSYDRQDFAVYFMAMYLLRQATVMWSVLILDRGIRRGELAPQLLRPMPPVWAHIAEHLGEIIVRLPIILAIFLLGLYLTDTLGNLTLPNVPLFILALVGSWLIFFHLHYCVGLLAFWMDGVLSLEPLIWYFTVILGGGAIPIDLFPTAIRDILTWLPFAATLDFPAQILLGKIAPALLVLGFAKQIAWVATLTLLRQALWRAGLRRYSAMGA
ncbi:MAG TPA: ABC-2 family transporter protein [Dongiaceae bacterium]|nr:ABC-2 family transporter protein [Dongiaceae bacterium]